MTGSKLLEREMVTTLSEFSENKPEIDPLNECRWCSSKAGKYINKKTLNITRVWLFTDAREFPVCNLCKDKGLLIPRRKYSKSEKKKMKRMRFELSKVRNIPHVTLDSQGKVVA